MDDDAHEFIERIHALDEQQEGELLDDILTGGYDQGCFLRPEVSDLLPTTDPAVTDAVLGALVERGTKASPTAADPFEHDALPTGEAAGTERGYVVVTQRCDLVRSLSVEPFVELAGVELVRDKDAIGIAKRNSPRFIFVADHPEGAWVADLRRRVVLAKDRLPKYPALQLVAAGEPHKRFKLRAGQRYSRDALPTELVNLLQRPLVKLLSKSGNMKNVELFSDLIAFRNGDQVQVAAVFGVEVNQHEAEDAWQALEDAMPDELRDLIHEDSGAVSVAQLNFWTYVHGWKLDLDEVTHHKKAGDAQAPPSL